MRSYNPFVRRAERGVFNSEQQDFLDFLRDEMIAKAEKQEKEDLTSTGRLPFNRTYNLIKKSVFSGKSVHTSKSILELIADIQPVAEQNETLNQISDGVEPSINKAAHEWSLLHGVVKNFTPENAAPLVSALVGKGANPSVRAKTYVSAFEYALLNEKFAHAQMMLTEMVRQDMDGWVDAFGQAQALVKEGKLRFENYQYLVREVLGDKPLYYANIQVRAYEIFGGKLNKNPECRLLVELFNRTGLFGLHAYFSIQLANGKEGSGKLQRKLNDFIKLVKIIERGQTVGNDQVNRISHESHEFAGRASKKYTTLRLAFCSAMLSKPSEYIQAAADKYAAYFNAQREDGTSMDRVVTLMKAKGCEIKASNAASAVQVVPELANKEKAGDTGNGLSSTVVRRTYTITAPISTATTMNPETKGSGHVSALTALFEKNSHGKPGVAPN